MAAVHSILRFVRTYTSETHAVPVGVVLWHEGSQSYVGFKAIGKDEPVRKLSDERDRMLIHLTIDRIRDAIETRIAPHDRKPSNPHTNQWWSKMRGSLVHSLRLTEPRAIDLPATNEGLEQLYEMTMRPFRIPAVLPPGAYTDMHAELRDGKYEHFYPTAFAVRMCSPRGPVHAVRVRPDDNGTHWGWWDAERQHFTMIWGSRLQVDVCFPGGSDANEAVGNGLVCRLGVEKLGDAK